MPSSPKRSVESRNKLPTQRSRRVCALCTAACACRPAPTERTRRSTKGPRSSSTSKGYRLVLPESAAQGRGGRR